MKVIHVVKRFGPVGAQSPMCDRRSGYAKPLLKMEDFYDFQSRSMGNVALVEIVELGELGGPKPAVVSMLRFSHRLTRYLDKLNQLEHGFGSYTVLNVAARCSGHNLS